MNLIYTIFMIWAIYKFWKLDIEKYEEENPKEYITIYACDGSEDPKWIYHEHDNNYNFECSECGSTSEFPTSYCPHCGEKLKNPDRKEITDDTY